METILVCRPNSALFSGSDPSLQNYESNCDSQGNFILQPKEPVAKAMAKDFSVSELALYGRTVVSPVRISADLTDLNSNPINE